MNTTKGARGAASVGLIALLFVAIFGPSLFSRGPWNPDEPRYIEVAREMGVRGEYMLPRLNGEPYGEKPPFYFWLVVAAERATGDWLVAGRLVSAVALASLALLTALFARRLYDDGAVAAGAAAMILTSGALVDHGQRALIDPTFAALVVAAAYGLFRATDAEGRGAKVAFSALAALAMGAGVITKGPLAVLLPPLMAGLLGWARAGRRGVPVVSIVAGILVAAAIGLGWLFLAAEQAGELRGWYLERMGLKQTLDRAVDSYSHKQPFYYYTAEILWGIAPWIVLLPATVKATFAARKEDRAGWGLLLWAGVLFVLFSAISGKRPGYIMPIYPALAILIARRLAELRAGKAEPGALDRVPAIAGGVVLAALGVLVAVFPLVARSVPSLVGGEEAPLVEEFLGALPPYAGLASVLAGALLIALGAAAARAGGELATRRFVLPVAAAAALVSLAMHAIFVPALDPQKSARALGEHVAREYGPRAEAERLVLYGSKYDGMVNYWTGALSYPVAREAEDLEREMDAPGRIWIIAHERHFNRLSPALRQRIDIRGTYRVGSRLYYFLCERES